MLRYLSQKDTPNNVYFYVSASPVIPSASPSPPKKYIKNHRQQVFYLDRWLIQAPFAGMEIEASLGGARCKLALKEGEGSVAWVP